MIALLLPLVCLAYLLWIGLNSMDEEESYDSLLRRRLEDKRERSEK